MARPPVDYTLRVHKLDELGNYYVDSPEEPGLLLYGKNLELLLEDVPRTVTMLRAFDRQQSNGNGEQK